MRDQENVIAATAQLAESRVSTPARLWELLLHPASLDFIGGTSTFSDAREVWARYRQGESLLDGQHIAAFEQALREYYGGLDAVTFGSGSMALYAIFKAMRLAEGDEIILPGYTCVVIPNAIRWAGLTPVYVDVSRSDFNLQPEAVAQAIGPRTRAILAQSTFGIPCDMDALLDISRRTGVPVIEDGAHAIGARWRGQLLGRLGLAGFFSTQATKMFSTERGGFVVTGDAGLAGRLREVQAETPFNSPEVERACMLRWCYRAAISGRPWLRTLSLAGESLARMLRIRPASRILDFDARQYDDALAGRRSEPYPVRLPNLMACVGLMQLRRLEQDLAHRRSLAAWLQAELPARGAKVAIYDPEKASPSWVRFPFVVENRPVWQASMRRNGVVPGVWLDDPIHPRGSDWNLAGYRRGYCPNAEYLARHVLNVPVHSRASRAYLSRWLKRIPLA